MHNNLLNSSNAPYIAELFCKFKENQYSVNKEWVDFFNSLDENEINILKDFGGPEWKKRPSNVIDKVSFNKTIRIQKIKGPLRKGWNLRNIVSFAESTPPIRKQSKEKSAGTEIDFN